MAVSCKVEGGADGWRCVSGVLIGVVVVRPFLFRNGRGAPDEPALAILPAPQRSPPSLQTIFYKNLCSGSSTKLVAIAQSPGRGRADGREQFVEAKASSKVVTGKHEIYMSVPKDALTGCVLPSSTYCWPTSSHQESGLVSIPNRDANSNHAAYLRISSREIETTHRSECFQVLFLFSFTLLSPTLLEDSAKRTFLSTVSFHAAPLFLN